MPPDTIAEEMRGEGVRAGRDEATEIIRNLVRLADMGFEESMREPEENGNFAWYERAKRYLAAAPATPSTDAAAIEREAMMRQQAARVIDNLRRGDIDEWRGMERAPRDGTIVELLVDYSADDAAHPLNDATLACTIGFNNHDDNGEDEWKFAGWCWSHDHFVQGRGVPIAWRPSRLNDALGALPALAPKDQSR